MQSEPIRSSLRSARGTNFFDADINLQFEVAHRVAPKDRKRAELWLRELGRMAGDELDRLATRADMNPPKLRQFDPVGNRIDVVEYDPAYRQMEAIAFERFALAAMSHRAGILGWPIPVPHVVKFALSYVFAQAEFGLLCPVSMTDVVARGLRQFANADLKARFLPRLTASNMKELWQGAMFLTEQQCGSDLADITTVAKRIGDVWRLYGEKWFCSNIDADVVLTLARPEGGKAGTAGLALFLVPRVLPDQRRNSVRIKRLKATFGARSMATGEVVFDGAVAHLVGDPQRGFQQASDLVNVSRLSNAMRSVGLMRRGLHEALVHAQDRRAFGQTIRQFPLVRTDLANLIAETEAATAFVIFTAQVLDHADTGDEPSQRLVRILAPLAKHAICARARAVTAAAMEIQGGNGYVEDWVHPRLARDVQLGSIWEGTSNVVAIDVIRAIRDDRASDVLQRALNALLETCRNFAVAAVKDELTQICGQLFARIADLTAQDRSRRDPAARALANALYALTCGVLLAQEAEWMIEQTGSARKLLITRIFITRNLVAQDPLALAAPQFTEEQADALLDWSPLSLAGAAF